ncbi:3-deoxy-manno-octulosonate cytidylyltransferase [Phycisphaerales bacterium AB-hyl4]|uniref:3-deoxy-manno-octulosonate cytidylyltransferase n=1 Tax=Natronomicrosphaera hydrolytica TaxID=3242702 RepID=A0ABV4U9E7_9BACT
MTDKSEIRNPKSEIPLSAIALIPARYASTRLPGKPLLDRTGKPMIQHVVERVREAKHVSRVAVATDDQRIYDAVLAFGGEAVMTRADHPNGTSRLAEAADALLGPTPEGARHTPDAPLIVNVQGDEPEIEASVIDQLIQGLANDPDAPMATLASPFAPDEDPANPNIVKVVVAATGRALYFSRALIPHDRDNTREHAPLKHPGLYVYRRWFLDQYVQLAPTPLEETEKLEQLRALEHGHAIAIVRTHVHHTGIDTPEQYDAFVGRVRQSTM